MRFTVPFLLAIAAFVATVYGANDASFTPQDGRQFDVVTAAQSISFRLERALGFSQNLALLAGGLLLALPGLLTFHLFRVGFGGSVQSIVQEHEHIRRVAEDRRRIEVARYTTNPLAEMRPGPGLSGDGAPPETASPAAASSAVGGGADRPYVPQRKPDRSTDGERHGRERRGLGANIAAALSRGSAKDQSTPGATVAAGTTATSGMTSLSRASAPTEAAGNSRKGRGETGDMREGSGRPVGRLKEHWNGLLDNKPDLSGLKSSAQRMRDRIGARGAGGKTTTLADKPDS